MQTNLIVRSHNGQVELPIGKTVEYRGQQIVHAYVYGKYQKHSIHAWGVRYPLAHWMGEAEVDHLYFWDNKAKLTYHIELALIRALGTPGEQDQFGGTLNVPRDAWDLIERKLSLPWVPDQHVYVLPPCREPWPLPERFVPEPEPVVPPRRRRSPAGSRDPVSVGGPGRSNPGPSPTQPSLFD